MSILHKGHYPRVVQISLWPRGGSNFLPLRELSTMTIEISQRRRAHSFGTLINLVKAKRVSTRFHNPPHSWSPYWFFLKESRHKAFWKKVQSPPTLAHCPHLVWLTTSGLSRGSLRSPPHLVPSQGSISKMVPLVTTQCRPKAQCLLTQA